MGTQLVMLFFSLLAPSGRPVVAVEPSSPCAAKYADWLSPQEVLTRNDQPKHFPGLHVLCIWQEDEQFLTSASSAGLSVEVFSGGVDLRAQGVQPRRLKLPLDALASWKAFRASLKEKIGFTKASNNWGHLALKQAFGLFDSSGHRLSAPRQAVAAQLVLLFEGGQWIWPPVREGYVRQLGTNGLQLETLSVQPILFRISGFLRPNECDQIIDMGKPRMFNSPVSLMDKDKGRAAKDFRTSTQARLNHRDYPLLRDIDQRVAELTRVPAAYNEEVQILRYMKGQYYSGHLDNWDPQYYSGQDTSFMEHGHMNRLATVFWYLSDVKAGGETQFPRAGNNPQPYDLYACEQGLKVQPKKGAVIIWYSLHPNGNTDPNGLHSACPVKGEETKWSANYWVWNKPRRGVKLPDEGVDDEEPEEREPAPSEGVSALFKNVHGSMVKLFWKNPSGGEVFMLDISPDDTKSLNSFPSHVIVARAAAGEVLGQYKVGSEAVQNFMIPAAAEDMESQDL